VRLCDDCGKLVDRPPRSPVALCRPCARARLAIAPREFHAYCPYCGREVVGVDAVCCQYSDGDCAGRLESGFDL
jgi:ribosomal protein S12